MPADLDQRVRAEFTEAQLIELGLGLGLFHGFSKMLMAMGLEPNEMETAVLPTPRALGLEVPQETSSDPHVALLTTRQDLATRWDAMRLALEALPSLHTGAREAARHRLAQLYRVTSAPGPAVEPDSADPLTALVTECAELFAIDIRALTPDHLRRVGELTDEGGIVQLIMTLAVYDGIYRYWATIGEAA
jgi:hypothetical protein